MRGVVVVGERKAQSRKTQAEWEHGEEGQSMAQEKGKRFKEVNANL